MQRGGNFGRGGRGGARPAGNRARPTANNAQMRAQILTSQSNSVKRLQKDLKELKDSTLPLVGVSACPLDDNMFVWHGNIKAPKGTVYEGGVFHIEMTFPQDYPVSPPGLTIFACQLDHPNVFGTKLCLDMLEPNKGGKWYEGWNSAYTVESILIQLQSFLFYEQKKKKETRLEAQDIKESVDLANSYKCNKCKHRGSIEVYPPFNQLENDIQSFCFVRDPQQMLEEEFLCFHTRTTLAEATLGIGVSLSRLPRTGEIRSVTPSLDLLCLRAFTKQDVRKSIDGVKFTHWLPLYFGESEPYERKTQVFNNETKQYDKIVDKINPRERMIHLLKKSICFLTKKDTRKELTAEMVVEVMPKLLTTHLVDMVSDNTHASVVAIRRLVNFIRLFRLLIELKPEAEDIIAKRLQTFRDQPGKRVKDHCSALGDILSFATIHNEFKLQDVLDAYLEEQLDRQAFWIIRQIPELDHTDDKYKGKEIILEESRNEVCFKTGLTGFHITMIFHTLCEVIETKFKKNFTQICGDLDGNFGCLDTETENYLQKQFKAIRKVDNFNKYYQWLKRDCPDAEALALRLRQAITNSKEKKYHGSSEHMNELPEMSEQATQHLLSEPSPFAHYNEETKQFLSETDPFWKDAVTKKFDWVNVALKNIISDHTPSSLALKSDEQYQDETMVQWKQDALLMKHHSLRTSAWRYDAVMQNTVNPDYPATFSWRQLFHKLCFEQMLGNLGVTNDFKLFYDYIIKIGCEVPVLRVATIDKTSLKSNQYWLMALVSKMPNLRVLKLHKPQGGRALGADGYKFLLKGLNYMKAAGKQLEKVHFHNILHGNESKEYLYPCLKLHEDIQILSFRCNILTNNDSKAIGKVLADFKNIKELDLTNCGLNLSTTKDIADGLMRAKQLEIIKLGQNAQMGKSVNGVIYNLAFSPKIKHIDLEGMQTDHEAAEALFKLINISGSIETLNLRYSSVVPQLAEDFWKAVGQSKTLKYLNVDMDTLTPTQFFIGKAIAMNHRIQGNLEAVSMENWVRDPSYLNAIISMMKVSDQDYENWYGDKNIAKNMVKEQLVKKLHFGLKYMFIGGKYSKLTALGQSFKPKHILAQLVPEWPDIFTLMSSSSLVLDFGDAKFSHKDMELIAYTIGENPVKPCSITTFNLSKSPIGKLGAKLLAPALAINKSLVHLDLSSTKLGVSGIVSIAEALQKNATLKSLNLYRNILDVDGARTIGNLLKVNNTLEFLDLGHNRIRETGLKAICDGVLANPDSKLSQLGIRANFINDNGISYLFDKLIFPVYSIRKQQITEVYLKTNFLSEYFRISLAKQVAEQKINVFVDDFRAVDYLVKEKLDRSIWISPIMPQQTTANIKEVLNNACNDVGYIVDVRMSKGRKAPGRPQNNMYAVVEFADENSVARSLKVASSGRAFFSGIKVRIFRSGTQTAILQPQQKRR